MPQKLSVDSFEWAENTSESDERCISDGNGKYLKHLHEAHSGIPFLSVKMKVDKCNKPKCNSYNKKRLFSA